LATTHYQRGLDLLHAQEFSEARDEFEQSLSHLLRSESVSNTRDSLVTEVCRARMLADRRKIAEWRLFTLLDGEFVFNKDVQRWVEHYTMKDREYMDKALWRSQRYLSQIKKIFSEEGLPLELSYLPIIESGFHPLAHSRAGAVGLWQFVSSTAKKFDLRIDEWVDERRDPEKSTRAAAKFLTYLYENHGSWSLALAGYNWGPQRVTRSVNRTGNNDYWDLLLPKETAEFVPKFLATVLIALDPEVFGFEGAYTDQDDADTVIVKGCVDLGVVASVCNIQLSLLRELNPELREDFTPPSDAVYSLNIPGTAKQKFKSGFYALPESERYLTQQQVEKMKRKRWITYGIKWGDTLSGISRRFGVSVAQLRKWNSNARGSYIRAGQKLRIYVN
jgi:membrane-bound lytic murein transglycosylase D